jgi:hypothetical protein
LAFTPNEGANRRILNFLFRVWAFVFVLSIPFSKLRPDGIRSTMIKLGIGHQQHPYEEMRITHGFLQPAAPQARQHHTRRHEAEALVETGGNNQNDAGSARHRPERGIGENKLGAGGGRKFKGHCRENTPTNTRPERGKRIVFIT